jgi:hypothetical protein
MRKFLFLALTLGLTFIVALGAAFRPGDNLPGREVGAAESSRVIGGGGLVCTIVGCGASGTQCALHSCINGPGNLLQCNSNCNFIGGCTGG